MYELTDGYYAKMVGNAESIITNLLANFYVAKKGTISDIAYGMAKEWLACARKSKLPSWSKDETNLANTVRAH